MTDGKFCFKCLSQYHKILSKMGLFGTGKYLKLGIYMSNGGSGVKILETHVEPRTTAKST